MFIHICVFIFVCVRMSVCLSVYLYIYISMYMFRLCKAWVNPSCFCSGTRLLLDPRRVRPELKKTPPWLNNAAFSLDSVSLGPYQYPPLPLCLSRFPTSFPFRHSASSRYTARPTSTWLTRCV